MVFNTSFNENEPIVCKPAEALDCFLRTKMDVLVLGNSTLVRQKSERPSASGHQHPQAERLLRVIDSVSSTWCSSSLDPKCRNRLPNIAGHPTVRMLQRAAHKNNDPDNASGSVAIRIRPPRDNAARRADRLGGRHRQLG
jgi:hypothetical protein